MNEKRKWVTAGRLRRGAAALGVLGLTAGAALMTAGSAAQAAVGTMPGDLQLVNAGTPIPTPGSGALSLQPTWDTIGTPAGCPTGFQAAANIEEYTTAGAKVSLISPNVTAGLTAAFSGTLDGTVGALLNFAGFNATTPGTVEWVVQCWSGAGGTGTAVQEQDLFVSVAAGATTFTTSAAGPTLTPTTTTLTASPTTASSGGAETLSASVTATDGTTPAGTVQFTANGTNVGTPVAVNTGGVATPATTPFTAPTTATTTTVPLTAVFTPTATTYATSTGNLTLNVVNSAVQTAGAIPVDVTVPNTGSLTVTVSTTAITLTTGTVTSTTIPATGTLNTVSVSDTRNNVPGWSVSGQDTVFTGSGTAAGATIPGDDMGWAPTCATLATGAVCGATVAPGTSPGLADTAQVLASAAPGGGTGSSSLSAALTLNIPVTNLAGPYTSTLTITYLLS
jgi:hypothetical protein